MEQQSLHIDSQLHSVKVLDYMLQIQCPTFEYRQVVKVKSCQTQVYLHLHDQLPSNYLIIVDRRPALQLSIISLW